MFYTFIRYFFSAALILILCNKKLNAQVNLANFEITAIDGKHVKMSNYSGKCVFIEYWATWCGPCHIQLRNLDSLYSSLADSNIVVLLLNIEGVSSKWIEYKEKLGIKNKEFFCVNIDSSEFKKYYYSWDSEGNYLGYGLPKAIILDENSYLIKTNYRDYPVTIDKILEIRREATK